MKAGILTLALCSMAVPAYAQMQWTDKGFFNVNGGVQTGSHTLGTNSTFSLYDENGTLTTTQSVKGGGFFDLSAGYKVWRNLALGIGYSRMKSDSDVAITAGVPDPVFFDQLRPLTTSASGAGHTEQAINLSATWVVPVTDKVDVDIVAGPTIFMIKQDVPTAITVTEPGPALASTSMSSEDKTTGGVHFGFDVNYLITPRYGVGVVGRYSWGSVNLPGASGNLTVGGFDIGVGARIRF